MQSFEMISVILADVYFRRNQKNLCSLSIWLNQKCEANAEIVALLKNAAFGKKSQKSCTVPAPVSSRKG